MDRSWETKVLLVPGTPGCGKTTPLCQMCRDGWTVFDDFKANAFNHSSGFVVSRKFSALLAALRDDLRCVLADIDFCKPDPRAEAESVLRIEAPGLNLAWKFFANDSPACEANIRRRGRASLASDLENLRKYSAIYYIPPAMETIGTTQT